MITIRKAIPGDVDLILPIARQTFIESHGHSAQRDEIADYMARKFTGDGLLLELSNDLNHFYLLFDDDTLVGYSKIIMNVPIDETPSPNVAKLERIYFLQSFHGRNLAQQLFDKNIELAKSHQQDGIWLYVWKENPRAIAFYMKNGFKIVGEYDFEISPTHVNPNHILFRST